MSGSFTRTSVSLERERQKGASERALLELATKQIVAVRCKAAAVQHCREQVGDDSRSEIEQYDATLQCPQQSRLLR